MELSGKIIFFAGLLLLVISHFYVVVNAFRYRFVQGFFCLFVPAYIFYFALREETRQAKAIKMYGFGIVLLIGGAVVLSF